MDEHIRFSHVMFPFRGTRDGSGVIYTKIPVLLHLLEQVIDTLFWMIHSVSCIPLWNNTSCADTNDIIQYIFESKSQSLRTSETHS